MEMTPKPMSLASIDPRVLLLLAALVPAATGLTGVVVGAALGRSEARAVPLAHELTDSAAPERGALALSGTSAPAVPTLEFAASAPTLDVADGPTDPPAPDNLPMLALHPAVEWPLASDTAIVSATVGDSNPEVTPARVEPPVASTPAGTANAVAVVASTQVDAPPAAKPARRPGAGRFVVQAGAFASRGNAEALQRDLRRRGVDSELLSGSDGNGFRVVLGRYGTWTAAERASRELRARAGRELFARRLEAPNRARDIAAL